MSAELYSYLLLVLVGFLPNELWRMVGLVAAVWIDEGSPMFAWARAVSTAVLAGVIAKLILLPPGLLASVALSIRLAAIASGVLAFWFARRSVLAGIVAGEIVLVAGSMLAAV